jgi:quercetin dioxygenase-like cupin family protein
MSEIMKLKETVAYQDHAAVSKTLVEKKGGTVTLFAFDSDQNLSEHTAPFDALVLIMEGDAEISISGKPLRLTEGEMIVMPAGKPHAVRALGRFKMMLVMIKSK